MDERTLDRAIDTAARALVAREPGRALGYSVMERVGQNAAPAPRRFVRVAAAAVVLCAGIATMFVSRSTSDAILLPRELALPVAQAARMPEGPAGDRPQAQGTRRVAVRSATRTVARAVQPPGDISPIAPIETQPIALAALEVPQLEAETTSVDPITIEPLMIEPLAASND